MPVSIPTGCFTTFLRLANPLCEILSYFNSWTSFSTDWDGLIPYGAGLRFRLTQNATILWTLPESDNGDDELTEGIDEN